MLKNHFIPIGSSFIICLLLLGCQADYLEQRPDKKLLVPQTLDDFLKLLDNSNEIMNFSPGLPEIGTDNFYAVKSVLLNLPEERNAYSWQSRIFENNQLDWDRPYQQVLYANIVLEGLAKIDEINTAAKEIKGMALFARALAHYHISQQFAGPYDSKSAGDDAGIPIRQVADINLTTGRSSIADSYNRIIKDLEDSSELLPNVSAYRTRPTKPACFAMLSRLYLLMQDYEKAQQYADKCLTVNSDLLDYNLLDSTVRYPFPKSLPDANREVIYHSVMLNSLLYLHASGALLSNVAGVDSSLYALYAQNDLRKVLYFSKGSGIINFRGSYTGNYYFFSGIATDEIYLIRAECQVRTGEWEQGMETLNQMLRNRFKNHTLTEHSVNNAEGALNMVLTERRKELVFRGSRWSDLRRLNQEAGTASVLTRLYDDTELELRPNDGKYVFPIPNNVISYTGMEQNVR